MTDDKEAQEQDIPTPHPALERLGRLVGTWTLSGRSLDSDRDNISGTTTFKWLHDADGSFFLQQDMVLDYDGQPIRSHELTFQRGTPDMTRQDRIPRADRRSTAPTCRLTLLLLTLAACDAGTDDTLPIPADTIRPAAEASDTPASIEPDALIRADGIAHARSGMTIGELRSVLPADMRLGTLVPFMVDIDAMPVVRGADTLYYVLIVAGEPSSDDAAVSVVATENESLRTAEGIGPGSTLAEAAAAYGAPTLSFNTNDESREYASFPRLPESIRVRVTPASNMSAYAGMYDTQGEHNETSRYDPAARVMMVLVETR